MWPSPSRSASGSSAAVMPCSRSAGGSRLQPSSRRSRTASRLRWRAMPRIRCTSRGIVVVERVDAGVEQQRGARDRLLRPVVEQQREPAALRLLRLGELVREAGALALAALRLVLQAAEARVEARVLGRAGGEVGEHPQLRELGRRERRRRTVVALLPDDHQHADQLVVRRERRGVGDAAADRAEHGRSRRGPDPSPRARPGRRGARAAGCRPPSSSAARRRSRPAAARPRPRPAAAPGRRRASRPARRAPPRDDRGRSPGRAAPTTAPARRRGRARCACAPGRGRW